MPVNTGFGNFSIGKDVRLDVTLKSGRQLAISNITDFEAKPQTKKLASDGLDGINRHAVIPQGYSLSFSIDRADRTLDDWWDAYEVAYYAGDTVTNSMLTQTINEADGSISQWRFEGLAINLDDLGNWKGDAFVKQKLTAMASKRIRVV